MKLAVRFLPEARQELNGAVDWYEEQRGGLGEDLADRVAEVLARIEAMPELHAPVYFDVREAIVNRFPYAVYYRVEAGGLLVISVFHTARDPSTWQSRS